MKLSDSEILVHSFEGINNFENKLKWQIIWEKNCYDWCGFWRRLFIENQFYVQFVINIISWSNEQTLGVNKQILLYGENLRVHY